MEEGVRSGEHSGTLVKRRNSSGCLIVRKKGDGMSRVGSSGSRRVFETKKDKKRPKLVISDSGSSDELLLEPIRRRVGPGVNKACNGSFGFDNSNVEDAEVVRMRNRAGHGKPNGVVDGEDVIERKRSRLDVFEFDEYDGIDGKKMRGEYLGESDVEVCRKGFFGSKSLVKSGSQREFETGSSRHLAVDKRKHSYFDRSLSGERNRGAEYSSRHMFETKRHGARLSDSHLREFRGPSDEPIRLQGKNGVLKVMVNKKKKVGGSTKGYVHHQVEESRKDSRLGETVKGNVSIRPSSLSETKLIKKPGPDARTGKIQLNIRKSLPAKRSKAFNSESEDSDAPLKLGSKNVEARSSKRRVKSGGEKTPPSEKILPTRSKEGKVRRGSGTEKQLLRERIRGLLVSAGWTIDYRPRKNRDYLDAVYINPSGTAYWSIIKAYDALQKQLQDGDNDIKLRDDFSPFCPISEEVLSKLTRQTRKKIEKEMRKKGRDNDEGENAKEATVKKSATNRHHMESSDSASHEEKLSSFIRENGKSLKVRLNEADSRNGGNSTKEGSHSRLILGRKSRKIGRCTLLVRGSGKGQNSGTDGFVPYTGKRTLLSWLIDSGTVQSSEKVQYMNRRRTRIMLVGWVTRDGIHCGCCSKILSVSKFEIHAGSKLRQPFQNIFLESGVSLLQCQLEAWNRQEESERNGFRYVDIDGDDPNDDTCGICGDGGDLICCDGCPSTFHQSCLHIQVLPPGEWHCTNCSCKFCGIPNKCATQGSGRTVGELQKCSLCDKKYHESCIQEMDVISIDSSCPLTSFCSLNCRELYERLQKFLGIKHELEAGFSWSLIHRTDPDSETSLSGFPQRVECNSKLAVALTVMDECFLPVIDRRSRINLIRNVLYNCGSNFSRLDYSGFYTAILEKGDEIISAASIRIHGTQLAEMPYIGTRHIYRRQGMCHRLFCAIESALCSLKVGKLIIPAISDLMHTWTVVFGFKPLEESHKEELRSLNMLVFPGTDMLQKRLLVLQKTEANITASIGKKSIEPKGNNYDTPDWAAKSDTDSNAGHDLPMCDDADADGIDEDDGVAFVDSGLPGQGIPSNDVSVLSSSSDAPHEIKIQVISESNLCSRSQSGDRLAESATEEKFLSPSDVGDNVLGMEKPLLDSIVEGTVQSSVEHEVSDAHERNVEAACVGSVPKSLGETFAENAIGNTGKELNENWNVISVSTFHSTDESTVQFNSDLNYQNAFEMERKSCVALPEASDTTHFEESILLHTCAASSGTDACEVKTESASL